LKHPSLLGSWSRPGLYREALLIFYEKVSIYLRIMGREFPGHWKAWIG